MRPVPVAAIALGAALIHLVLALLALEPAPYAGGDNATYVALARSLLERGDYTETWDPALRPATLYPPVFPSLLAGAIALGASTWVALKTVMAVLSALLVAVSVLWLARVGNRWIAAAGGLALAAMPGILAQTHLVLSEIPFAGFALLALWAFAGYEASAEDAAEAKRATTMLALAAAATALAWLTRSAGVALALALLLRLALTRRGRDAVIFAAIALLPVAAWWLRGRVLAPHGYSQYLMLADPYRPELGTIGVLGLVPRVLENARSYLLGLAPRFLAGEADLGVALALVLLALALARWAWRLARGRGAPELFVLFYGGLVLIWPETWAGERFVLPLAPLLLYYAADAVRALSRRLPLRRQAAWGVAMLALVMVIPGADRQLRRGIECRAQSEAQAFPCTLAIWRDLFEVAATTRGRLEPDAVVIARKPSLFHDLSGYRSAVYPWSADPDVFFALVDSIGADYVVLDRSPDTAEDYLVPVLEARSADFCVLPALSRPMAVLLRIDRAGAREVSQAGAADGQVRFRTCEAEA